MKSPSSAILTVGSIAFDSILTPSGKADRVLGGSGNYFSVAASFYAPVRVVGVVGDDFPKDHLNWLSKRDIDVSGIECVPGKTFHWVGEYGGSMNEATTLSTALNVFEHFKPKLSEIHRDTPYVFLANIDPVLQLEVLEQVRSPRLVACDSMNFWITGKPSELRATLKQVDLVSLNETEARLLSGKDTLAAAAKEILTLGPRALVLKRGEHGATLFTSSGIFLAPAFPHDRVVDPTGAGDTFAGAFMGYLARAGVDRNLFKTDPARADHELRQAVLAGCVMASYTVEDFSLHRLMRLEEKELVDRGRILREMIRV